MFIPSVQETCQIDEKCIGMHFSLTPDMRWGKKEPNQKEREMEGPVGGLWDSEVRKEKRFYY